jgi:hypothetical protein
MQRRLVFAIIWLAAGHATVSADSPKGHSPFATIVLREFDTWDKEHQGRLTFPVVERWTHNPSLRGDAAAAMAQLHLVLEKESKDAAAHHQSHVSEFTRDYFERYNQMSGKERWEHHNFDGRFSACKRKVADESRKLFPDGMPKISAMRQGRLGDCHFLGPLGSMVFRRPSEVKEMIKGDQEHGYKVHFPRRPPTAISPLTDTELALFSSAGSNGIWLAVMEKACGELRRRGNHVTAPDDFDALVEGPAKTRIDLALLTGHHPDPLVIPAPSQSLEFKQAERKLREALLRTNHSKHLCTASSRNENKAKAPPGMAGSHSYAVLGFNKSNDTIHLWNPWGHEFTPKGREGLQSGYKTMHGAFEMPLKDFVHEFSVVCCESNQAVEHPSK